MSRHQWTGAILAAVVLLLLSVPARAQEYSAKFSGFQEVGGVDAGETGAILSTGQATLKLTLDQAAQTLTYKLTYSKEHVAGGIMVFFCSNLGNGPAGTPTCPDDTSGEVTVTGTITAAGVVGPTAQNITPGDFAGVVAALASNTAYGNIHTKQFPAGEIRGQVHAERRDKDDGDDSEDKDNR